MAFIILENHKGITLPHEKALALKWVRDGVVQGSDKQKAFARKVKAIYFGRQHDVVEAPPEARPYKD